MKIFAYDNTNERHTYEINEKLVDSIKAVIETALKKFGIYTKVSLEPDGRHSLVKIVSEPYETHPAVFKSIEVYGNISGIMDEEDKEVLNISLSNRYELFSGGYNGNELCSIRTRIYPKLNSMSNSSSVSFNLYV